MVILLFFLIPLRNLNPVLLKFLKTKLKEKRLHIILFFLLLFEQNRISRNCLCVRICIMFTILIQFRRFKVELLVVLASYTQIIFLSHERVDAIIRHTDYFPKIHRDLFLSLLTLIWVIRFSDYRR